MTVTTNINTKKKKKTNKWNAIRSKIDLNKILHAEHGWEDGWFEN